MRVPLSWLTPYLDTEITAERAAEVLTLAGLEVEGIDRPTQGDPVLEIALTPNLGHCMSVLGIARELAALLNVKLKRSSPQLEENASESIDQVLKVELLDREQCLRYSCRVIQDVKIAPSPSWLKGYLEACGLRSINNVVDIANFVMLECGQPMHMFDYDMIAQQTLIISSKAPENAFTALDEKNYVIPEGALAICDPLKVLALAGIIGSQESAVSEKTCNIVIESAYFTPQAIRRTSKQLGLRTDSSQRFDKGIDPNGCIEALNRAASLVQQLAGGKVVKGIIDLKTQPFHRKQIACRVSRVNQILGTQLSMNEVIELLTRLEIQVQPNGQDVLNTHVPTYRHDLQIEIDLIEEVARVYGYNNLPKKAPYYMASTIPDSPIFTMENSVRTKLIEEGLQEWITCNLISPTLNELTKEAGMPPESSIAVLHPSSVDQSILRSSLLPCFLQMLQYNKAHQNHDISAFEVGRVHFKNGAEFAEQSVAGIVLAGKQAPYHWDPKPREVDFFDLKGIVENVLKTYAIEGAVFEVSHLHNFHPGRQARIKVGEATLGVLGEVHPQHLNALGIEGRALFAEINLHDLFAARTPSPLKALPAYPGSERDWTIMLADTVAIDTVLHLIQACRSPLLEKVTLLDLYKSEQIGKDRKNATFRFVYRDLKKTISQEVVEQEHANITQQVTEKLAHHPI